MKLLIKAMGLILSYMHKCSINIYEEWQVEFITTYPSVVNT